MNTILISMFIDDAMTIDEKIAFVENIHTSKDFKEVTVDLLHQEKRLRSDPIEHFQEEDFNMKRFFPFRFLRPLGLIAAGIAVALFLSVFFTGSQDTVSPTPYRFVLYQPDVKSVDIMGSFTGWQPYRMEQVGASGYWEYRIDLSHGEHRFAYVLDGQQRIADPTIPAQEGDDFGGKNTILSIGI